jgi:nitric oxide reductase NorQ protein
LSRDLAERLVSVAEAARRLKGHGLDEGISTRMLVHAGSLIRHGVAVEAACQMALIRPLTDDADLILALDASMRACL